MKPIKNGNHWDRYAVPCACVGTVLAVGAGNHQG